MPAAATDAGVFFVRDNVGKYWLFDTGSMRRFSVGGPGTGSFDAAVALYGQPVSNVNQLPDEVREAQQQFAASRGLTPGTSILLDVGIGITDGGSAVSFYGGPNMMEMVVSGVVADPFTNATVPNPTSITNSSGRTFPAATQEEHVLVPGVPAPQVPARPTPERDRAAEARALYPWLPDELLEVYVEEWTETDRADLAWAAVREHELYDQFFAGNRRDDGSVRFNEAQYVQLRESFNATLRDYGLNPDVFGSAFGEALGNDLSVSEVAARLDAVNRIIVGNADEIRRFYADNYGLEMTDAALLASALDTDVERAIFERRLSIATVGGEAARSGFAIDAGFADSLVGQGLDQGGARQLFGQAAGQLPTLDVLSKRFRDRDDTFELDEFSDAFLGDAAQQARIRSLLGQEASSFSRQAQVAGQNGALSGLADR